MIELSEYLKPFNEFYEEIYNGLSYITEGKFNRKSYYRFIIKGAYTKSLEFNYFTSKLSSPDGAFFQMGSLRSICEDIIVISYLKSLSAGKRKEIISSLMPYEMDKNIIVQYDFLQKNNPAQIIIPIEIIQQERIEFIRKTHRHNLLPSVYQMAKYTNCLELYSYLYYATSAIVHFRLDTIMKMGWGNFNSKGVIDIFTFSTTHFSPYYVSFNIIYGTYLFREFIKRFSTELNIDYKSKMMIISEMDKLLDTDWPEIVTFEHMNIKPPNSLQKLLRRFYYKNPKIKDMFINPKNI